MKIKDKAGKFQFQNGAIKRKADMYEAVGKALFQFQNGAIKRLAINMLNEYGDKFQFQNGAIKRIPPKNPRQR